MNITGFDKVAQYLTHPLVLAGFVLMLAYGIHWQLMKSGLLAQVSKKDSGIIIRLFLRYGFWLALTLLLAGIGLSAWNSYMEKEKVQEVDANKLAREVIALQQKQLEAKDELIKVLTEAFADLPKTGAPTASITAALQEAKKGNTVKAQDIFAQVAAAKEAAGKKYYQEAAKEYRHVGALAFLNDTKVALAAYQKAVELDPDNAEGWKYFGHLLYRTGELAQAQEAYRKVLVLGEAHKNKEEQAIAYSNLGLVYTDRRELDKAVDMHRKALEIIEALGRKEGMAAVYGNLGIVYEKRGELDKAKDMHMKALKINNALNRKEGMAANYANLGIVYATRGQLDKAEDMFNKTLEISVALGRKESMARSYGNLGLVYVDRGELNKAEDMYKKSLKISEALGLKKATANQYDNLGAMYKKRGELDKAETAWQKSLRLFLEMGHPNAKMVQQALDELALQKAGGSQ